MIVFFFYLQVCVVKIAAAADVLSTQEELNRITSELKAYFAGKWDDGMQVHYSMFISQKYASGEYLIYDCIDRHFACVDKYSYEECQLAREQSITDKEAGLACAPLMKYEFFLQCAFQQQRYIESRPNKSFCLNKNISD